MGITAHLSPKHSDPRPGVLSWALLGEWEEAGLTKGADRDVRKRDRGCREALRRYCKMGWVAHPPVCRKRSGACSEGRMGLGVLSIAPHPDHRLT